MATTKIWKVIKRMDHVIGYATNKEKTKIEIKNYEMYVDDLRDVIDYARNSDKTEEEYFVTGINCEPQSAYEEMQDVKMYYNKQNKILAFHAYQSFLKGELTPELAHKIGVELAHEIWGDRFQVIVTTHLNTNCLHNHFVVNSVSFKDGYKYYDTHSSYARIRHISDELCMEYGLSVLEEKPTKKTKINYEHFYEKSKYTNNYEINAKRDIDLAIRQAYSFDDFIYLMKKLDYEIIFRANKISIKHNNYNRNIRIERRFGEEYSIDNIRKRIIEEEAIRVPFIEDYYRKVKYPFAKRHKRAKAKGFVALYYHYCYLLKVFPDIPQQRLPTSIRADVARMNELSEEAKLLSKYKLKTVTDLQDFISETQFKISTLSSDRERLWVIRKLTKDDNERRKICNNISSLTNQIDELRKEVSRCKDIKSRLPKIEDNLNELDYQEEQAKNKENEKSKSKLRKEKNK